jgi:hypothetical protein
MHLLLKIHAVDARTLVAAYSYLFEQKFVKILGGFA